MRLNGHGLPRGTNRLRNVYSVSTDFSVREVECDCTQASSGPVSVTCCVSVFGDRGLESLHTHTGDFLGGLMMDMAHHAVAVEGGPPIRWEVRSDQCRK